MNTSTKLALQKQQPSSSTTTSEPQTDSVSRAEEAANRHFALAKAYFDPLGKSLDRAAALAAQEAMAEKELRRQTQSSSSSSSARGLILNPTFHVQVNNQQINSANANRVFVNSSK